MKKFAALSLSLVMMLSSAVVAFASKTTESPADKFKNKELSIAVFEGGYGRTYWEDIVEKFEEAYPGVKVDMQIDPEIGNLIAPQLAVGEWPDFISLSDTERSGVVTSMIKNEELLDLTDVFEGEALDRPGVAIADIIVPGMLESTKFSPYGDGKIYLAPFNVGPMGMVYNKTLFEEKGWELPSTWDDFFALAEELEKTENYVEIDGKMEKRSLFTYQGIYAGYLESVFWPAIAGAGGMEAIDSICNYEEGSFLTDDVKNLVETFAKIGTEGHLMEGTVALNHTQSQTDMMLGKALFIPNGTWMEGEMADAPREEGFEFAILPAPVMSSKDDHYVLSSYEQFEIPKQAKNPELAKEFLRFLYTEESIISFAENANGTIAVTDARDIAEDYLSPGVYGMFSAYETGKFMLMNFATLPADCKVNVGALVFDDNMGPLMTGSLSPEDYCEMVEEAFAEINEDMEKAGVSDQRKSNNNESASEDYASAYKAVLDECMDLIMISDSPNVAFYDVTGDDIPEMFVRRAVSESEYESEDCQNELSIYWSYDAYLDDINSKVDFEVHMKNLSLFIYTFKDGDAEVLFSINGFDGFVASSRLISFKDKNGFIYYHTVSPEGLWTPTVTYLHFDEDGNTTEYVAGEYHNPEVYGTLELYDSRREFSIGGKSVSAESFESELTALLENIDVAIITDLSTTDGSTNFAKDSDEVYTTYDDVYKYDEALEYLDSIS